MLNSSNNLPYKFCIMPQLRFPFLPRNWVIVYLPLIKLCHSVDLSDCETRKERWPKTALSKASRGSSLVRGATISWKIHIYSLFHVRTYTCSIKINDSFKKRLLIASDAEEYCIIRGMHRDNKCNFAKNIPTNKAVFNIYRNCNGDEAPLAVVRRTRRCSSHLRCVCRGQYNYIIHG